MQMINTSSFSSWRDNSRVPTDMHEIFEFRVVEEFADRLFGPDEGRKLGIVRVIRIAGDDPRLPKIGELDRTIHQDSGGCFFFGWRIVRKYSKEELDAATLLHLTITAVFEPAGEECGTLYDESAACPRCGAGAAQESGLKLDLRKVPKGKDIARTIADEWIVSQRLAERMTDAGLTGFELRPVRHKARYEVDPLDFHNVPTGRDILLEAEKEGAPHPTWNFWVWLNRPKNLAMLEHAKAEHVALKREKSRRSGKPIPIWYQLAVTSSDAEIVPSTRVGLKPFNNDPEGECRCPLGDTIGLALLSEVSISAVSRSEADIVCSRQFIGLRRGLLRPSRVILISPRFRKLIESESLTGVRIEVAHLV